MIDDGVESPRGWEKHRPAPPRRSCTLQSDAKNGNKEILHLLSNRTDFEVTVQLFKIRICFVIFHLYYKMNKDSQLLCK